MHRSRAVGVAGVALGSLADAFVAAPLAPGSAVTERTLLLAFVLAAIACLEAWAGDVCIVRALPTRPRSTRISESLRFLVAIALTCALAAGARTLARTGLGGVDASWSAWSFGALADLAGIVTIVPLLLLWHDASSLAAAQRGLDARAPAPDGEIRELRARLQQSQRMETLGRLAGGIAHDFNNLLTAMIGYAEVALQKLGPAHDGANDLEEIRRVAGRAGELTRQLLSFSRKHATEPQVVEVDEIVLGIERMLRRVIGEHVELVVRAGSAPATVRADPAQLEQVLLNLVVNARDAMPDGGRIEITTAVARIAARERTGPASVETGEDVEISVTDTGAGIAPEVLPHVFEPFFTTKRGDQGSGLGLAIVDAAVAKAGGHVRVESQVGRGTRVTVLLPRCEEAVVEIPRVAPAPPAGRETLLLVEDEHSVRGIASVELRSRGYRVLEAADGDQALALARAFPGEIHCLVSDVVMPRVGGRELAEQLGAERPGLRVLFVSGYAFEPPEHGLDDPLTAFLPKPFPPSELSRCVRELLDRESTTAAAR